MTADRLSRIVAPKPLGPLLVVPLESIELRRVRCMQATLYQQMAGYGLDPYEIMGPRAQLFELRVAQQTGADSDLD